ncbi:MAG: acetyl-CoA carboxylase biotin carboxyl carrier protein subunit [Acidobacteriota bacterium]|jgi:biotin carboxyl carrier protein|nr:acetyl-CoA carboxylase biotin carboxyl carrier protein subunit [Bryobacteraceae bacterium CoA2 C42]MCA2963947.1 acetyl-CoA carboxylase biotin carboxyl carrier protein subunit [Acidobacteriaceae bacterium]
MKPDIVKIRPGVYSVLLNGRSYTIHESSSSAWIALNAVEWERLVADPRRRAGGATASSAVRDVKAAMPGKVVRLLASPGDNVEAGQGLLILEAMKMQNELRSPRPGVVASVRIAEGDTVSSGQVLVTLE